MLLSALHRLILLAMLGIGLAGAAEPWPLVADGLPPDPAWVWGRLENGLRYVVRKNAQPAGHISLRFAVQVGFAHEKKGERGFAHFVEHMAFNGTTHYPGESLLAELSKHGVAVGPELSAFTLLTHTTYYLDAPSTVPTDLDRWFTVLRDFADGIQFEAKQVKRERGVIASETRDRQSVASRSDAARRSFLYPFSPLSNSYDGDVQAADRKRLRAFYDQWYRPERMILVAVGDVEPARLEALVRQHFTSLRARTPVAPRFDAGLIGNPAESTTRVFHEEKTAGLRLEVTSVLPRAAADNLPDRRQWVARHLLLYMLNVRLGQIVRNQPDRLFDLTAHSTIMTPYSIETVIGFTAPSSEWKFALTTAEQELRRSFEYVFRADEISEARSALLAAHEQQVKAGATAKSSDLSGFVMQQTLWDLIATAPEEDLRRTREWLPQIDALEINRAWRSLWQQRRAGIFGYGYFPVVNGSALVNAAFRESLAQPVAAPPEKKAPPFAYTDFGPAGKIKHRRHLPELDVHLLEFENGVRVNLKPTTFEAATVHLTARLARGMQTEPLTQPGLGALASGALLNGALGRHPPDELRRILSAANVTAGFSSQETYFSFEGQSASASLERQFQLLSAYLTDPAWSSEAIALARTQLANYSHDQNYSPEGIIGLKAFHLLSGGDQRYAPPSPEQAKARTAEELRAWLDPVLRAAPLEVGLVGDFALEPTIDLLRRTLGALPARTLPPGPERPVSFAKQPAAHEFSFGGENNRAGIEVVWPMDHYDDIKTSRQAEILCAILAERLRNKVREDLGAAYAPSVSAWKSDARPADGYILAYLTVKPEMVSRLGRLMVDIADNLARKGATVEELTRAREPILARSIADQRDNAYWVRHIMSRLQSNAEVRTWPLTRVSDFQTMTLAELNALARSVLPATRATTFTALPEKK
jgi:zinc protease